MQREANQKYNPFLNEAEKALNLNISDFSLHDKVISEKLLQNEKFKALISKKVMQTHKNIEMFENGTGVKSISDQKQKIRYNNIQAPFS